MKLPEGSARHADSGDATGKIHWGRSRVCSPWAWPAEPPGHSGRLDYYFGL
jgi:hypothetical protein